MPKFLLERWSAIDAEDVHLATIRVYPDAVGYSSKKPRIVLFLPPNTNTPSSSQASANSTETANANRPVFDTTTTYPPTGEGAEPDSYELDMVHDSVDNQVVVAERPKDASFGGGSVNTRARTTILTGRVKHECNLRPLFTKSYRRQMKERNRKYNTPHRQIMRIEEAGVSGGRGGINRLSSGVSVGSGHNFGELIVRARLHMLTLTPTVRAHRNRNQSLPKERSSAWRVCRETNSSIFFSLSFAPRHGGQSKSCVSERSSRKRTSKRYLLRLRICTGAENLTGFGS
jgi:hypothetical protein